ncbi:MAG TPA: hypothetical protein VEC19_13410 [Usitatibacter sp.]|nr:hypothetical protein [Usitatibacter sp.]
MGTKAILAIGTVVAVGTLLWLGLRAPDLPPLEGAPAVEVGAPAASARPRVDSAASAAKPRSAGDEAAKPRFVIATPPPTLFNEYLGARQYRILYDRLANSPEGQTADGKLVLYEILRQCATITEGRRPGYKPNPPNRDDFLKTLSPNDPMREKRIAAYEAFALDRCAGFEAMTIKHADLMKLLNDAAATGDPKARALAMEQELWRSRRRGGTLDDTQVDGLRQLAASKDPEAIRVAGRLMANSWNDYALRVGPDQLPVEQRAFVNAFLVLACEYGAPCGADTPRMQLACAMQGHCNAQNYPDYLYYYGSTPHDSAMLLQYRELVRQAIETGDWSQINVVRGLPPSGNRMTFVPGPR